jgi:hypothetical protein
MLGVSGARAFGGALTVAGKGVVEPARWPVAGPVAAWPVEQTALDL